jgi:hypothetical protein
MVIGRVQMILRIGLGREGEACRHFGQTSWKMWAGTGDMALGHSAASRKALETRQVRGPIAPSNMVVL